MIFSLFAENIQKIYNKRGILFVVWFHGISTLFRLFNAKAILLEEQ